MICLSWTSCLSRHSLSASSPFRTPEKQFHQFLPFQVTKAFRLRALVGLRFSKVFVSRLEPLCRQSLSASSPFRTRNRPAQNCLSQGPGRQSLSASSPFRTSGAERPYCSGNGAVARAFRLRALFGRRLCPRHDRGDEVARAFRLRALFGQEELSNIHAYVAMVARAFRLRALFGLYRNSGKSGEICGVARAFRLRALFGLYSV